MNTLTVRENFRVVVDVDEKLTFTKDLAERERLLQRRAEQIVSDIRRHVDGILGRPRVLSDLVCRFCGRDWETENGIATGTPVCCDKAVSEWQALQPESGQFGVGA